MVRQPAQGAAGEGASRGCCCPCPEPGAAGRFLGAVLLASSAGQQGQLFPKPCVLGGLASVPWTERCGPALGVGQAWSPRVWAHRAARQAGPPELQPCCFLPWPLPREPPTLPQPLPGHLPIPRSSSPDLCIEAQTTDRIRSSGPYRFQAQTQVPLGGALTSSSPARLPGGSHHGLP